VAPRDDEGVITERHPSACQTSRSAAARPTRRPAASGKPGHARWIGMPASPLRSTLADTAESIDRGLRTAVRRLRENGKRTQILAVRRS
jgi:hypothetical protein